MSLSDKKGKILAPIFIDSLEANKRKLTKQSKDILELKKTISTQLDLIRSIPEILAVIIRKEDIDGNNKIFQNIFKEFCEMMDKHGVSYDVKKLKSKIANRKYNLSKLENELEGKELSQ